MGEKSFYSSLLAAALGVKISDAKVLAVDAGQSNAAGSTDGVQPPEAYKDSNQNAFIMGWEDINKTEITTFQKYRFQTGNSLGSEFGVETSLFFEYRQTPIWVCKVTRAGSSIAQWAKGTDLYNELLLKIQQAVAQEDFDFIIFNWDQYESDINASASNYEASYKQLILDLETDLGFSFDYQLVAKTNPDYTFGQNQDFIDNFNIVTQAQVNLSNFYSNYYIIDFDSDDRRDDHTHYSADGNITRGVKVFNTIQSII